MAAYNMKGIFPFVCCSLHVKHNFNFCVLYNSTIDYDSYMYTLLHEYNNICKKVSHYQKSAF